MRVLFAGSPAIAIPAMMAIAAHHQLTAVLTNPPSEQGRGGIGKKRGPLPTEVAQAAKEAFGASAPIMEPEKLNAAVREQIASFQPEILVSFAYGKIFGPKFLALFPRGGLNIHPSLLPRHRGSSPIQQAILDRDTETGVCVQTLAPAMDTGDLYLVERIPLSQRETAASLSEICASLGARMIIDVLASLETGTAAPKPQIGEASYCRKISKEDGLLDWTRDCMTLDAQIRAFDPWPGTYTFFAGQRLNILEAMPLPDIRLPNSVPGTILELDKAKGIIVAAGQGALALRRLQFATRKALSYKEFANGVRNLIGSVLTS